MKKLERTLAKDTPQEVANEVLLHGFVQARRDHGKLVFIDLRDRSGLVQIVFNPRVSEKSHEVASTLRQESAVSIKGLVKSRPEKLVNPKVISGSVEVEAIECEILALSETLPFDMGGESLNLELPTLLDHRTLTLRHPKVRPIFEIQDSVLEGFELVRKKLECVEVVVPTIAASATEGGAEVFKFDYYTHQAFMTQSPQLYKQMMVPVFERVFTIAHAYRAEPSVTTRHLAETTMIDFEIGFVSFKELLDLFEQVMTETLKHIEDKHKDTLNELGLSHWDLGRFRV